VHHTSPRFEPGTALVLCACLLTVLVYRPGLNGDFLFDDLHVIVHNDYLQTPALSLASARQAALSSEAGLLLRPVSMLSFWGNYLLTGLDPFFFKLTGLLIHLAVGVALYRLGCHLLELRTRLVSPTPAPAPWAALAASLWLLHPLNLTGVLYVSQRMASLAALFTVLGLLSYLAGRRDLEEGRRRRGLVRIFLGTGCFGLLATLSKENGALILAYLFAIESAWLNFSSACAQRRQRLIGAYLTLAALGVSGVVLFLGTHPGWLSATYSLRDFTLEERLLTEARVLWLYLQWLLFPTPQSLGLFHDDIMISRGWLQPLSTTLAVLAWAGVAVLAWILRRRAAILALALAWYWGGHLLESTVIGLELVHEHRNYLPSFGPILLFTLTLASVLASSGAALRRLIVVALLVTLGFSTWVRALHWGDRVTFFQTEALHHPQSARANSEAGLELLLATEHFDELNPITALPVEIYLRKSADLDRSILTSPLNLLLLYAKLGYAPPEDLLTELQRRLREEPNLPTGQLNTMVKFLADNRVQIEEKHVRALFEAALDNTRHHERTRSILLAIAASYYGNVRGQLQDAVSLALAAVETDPGYVPHRLALADLAIKLGNPGLAAEQLDLALKNDRWGRYRLAMSALQDRLTAVSATHDANLHDS
jgi:hypothetical protein